MPPLCVCPKHSARGDDNISHATAETLEPVFMPVQPLLQSGPEEMVELGPDLASSLVSE